MTGTMTETMSLAEQVLYDKVCLLPGDIVDHGIYGRCEYVAAIDANTDGREKLERYDIKGRRIAKHHRYIFVLTTGKARIQRLRDVLGDGPYDPPRWVMR